MHYFELIFNYQRWLVFFGRYDDMTAIPLEKVSAEVEYVFTSLYKVKNNESAWNYLSGILTAFPSSYTPIKTGYA
jgi:hypothetical protein